MYELRPYQAAVVSGIGAAYRAKSDWPIAVAPTGGGKTVIASSVIEAVVRKDWRVLFLAHRQELIDQCSNKLRECGVAHGIVMNGRQPDRRHAVQVASVATMINRMDRYDAFDLVVIDEAHRSCAMSYAKICTHFAAKALARPLGPDGKPRRLRGLGLTATPTRLDGKGLGQHCGGLFTSIVPTVSTRELITMGYLVPYRYLEVPGLDLDGVKTRGGDYSAEQVEERVDRPKLIGDIVDHHAEYGLGRPSLVFAHSVAHGEHIAEEFRSRGLRALAVHAMSEKDVRKNCLIDLASRQLDVAVNVGLWIEGMDCPAISYIALGAPTKSLTRYLQSVGRGFRTDRDKTDLIIADHAMLQEEHYYPCIKRIWTLDGKGPQLDGEEAAISVKRCPQCYAVMATGATYCDCGAMLLSIPRPLPKAGDGKLGWADIDAVAAAEAAAEEEARKAEEARRALGAARTREELERVAAQLGYKPGAVDHRLKAREEKEQLRRHVIDLRIAAGDSTAGVMALKPKALRQEIESRLQALALADETEIAL